MDEYVKIENYKFSFLTLRVAIIEKRVITGKYSDWLGQIYNIGLVNSRTSELYII